MIFVTVGSQKFQFNRLLKAIDELVGNGEITEKVFAQSGASDYIPKCYQSQAFVDKDEYNKLIEECDLVITHGGTGAIINGIKAGKKVIAVPRLAKYEEHVDDHQKQLIEEFVKDNLICCCEDVNQLGTIIKEAKGKIFNTYRSNTYNYLRIIDEYISGLG